STVKIDSLSPRSPWYTSTATAGSRSRGPAELSTLPCIAAVGANRPVTASWLLRRFHASLVSGGRNFVVPWDSRVPLLVGFHWIVCVRTSPFGKRTVNVGA